MLIFSAGTEYKEAEGFLSFLKGSTPGNLINLPICSYFACSRHYIFLAWFCSRPHASISVKGLLVLGKQGWPLFKGLFSEKISHRPPETAFVLEQSITCAGLIKSSWVLFIYLFISKFPKSNSKKKKKSFGGVQYGSTKNLTLLLNYHMEHSIGEIYFQKHWSYPHLFLVNSAWNLAALQ